MGKVVIDRTQKHVAYIVLDISYVIILGDNKFKDRVVKNTSDNYSNKFGGVVTEQQKYIATTT